MFANILQLFFAILASYRFVSGNVYSTCYEFETYCLFSFGPNVTVNNVSEAQKICEDAKNGSWLLEIADGRVLKNVDEFLSSHPFPENTQLILNTRNFGNERRWIKYQMVRTEMLHGMNILSYEKSDSKYLIYNPQVTLKDKYTVICMTGCRSTITNLESQLYPGGSYMKHLTKNECLEQCETSECDAWEWDHSYKNVDGCWIHDNSSAKTASWSSSYAIYVMDKSVKTVEICIGNVTEPEMVMEKSINLNPRFYNTSSFRLIIVHVVPMIGVIAIMFIAVITYWKRKNKRREGTVDNCDLKLRAHPNSQQKSFQENRASLNQYEVFEDQPMNNKFLLNLEDENAYANI